MRSDDQNYLASEFAVLQIGMCLPGLLKREGLINYSLDPPSGNPGPDVALDSFRKPGFLARTARPQS